MNRWVKVAAVTAIILFVVFAESRALAATDVNAFSRMLGKIKTYDFGDSRADIIKAEDMIRESAGRPEMKDIEKQLDDLLKSDATYAAKDFVCRQLSVVGTEASVPALAPMLTDAKYSDMVRYALQRIDGAAVNEALRESLPKATGKAKVGIINTLGVRGCTKAVPALAGLMGDANETTAIAAAAALGNIADPCATAALAKAKDKAAGALRLQVLDSYLRCADRLAAKGQKDAASVIYKQLNAPSEPLPVRTAAVCGVIMTAGDRTSDAIVEVLKSGDKPMQTAAFGVLKNVATTDVVKAAAGELPNLAPVQQAQLLAALADCGDGVVLSAVLSAAKSDDESVRVAALAALGVLGNATTVDLLVQTAAAERGAEQRAARESLYRLRGSDIDRAVVDKLTDAEPKIKVELIRSCDQRLIADSTPALIEAARDTDEQVRVEAIKALRTTAGPGELETLIDLLTAASGTQQAELEKTVVAVARKIPADKNPAEKVLAALSVAKGTDAKCSLLNVLGRIGDPAAMPVLREALGDSDSKVKSAAIRALSDWPTVEPAADLLSIAETSGNQLHRTLALRGYIRLTGLDSDRPAEETVAMYKKAMELSSEPVEKRMVLSGLANTKSFEALQMAAGYLDDAELKQEAEAAVAQIAEATIEEHPQETKELLRKVLESSTSETVRGRAEFLLKRGN